MKKKRSLHHGKPPAPKPIAAQLSEHSGSPAALQALVSCRSHSPVCQLSIQFYLCSIDSQQQLPPGAAILG